MNLAVYESAYREFLALCPNSKEAYRPVTREKLLRWQYHIKTRRNMLPQFDIFNTESTEIRTFRIAAETLKAQRSFERWKQLPEYMKAVYLKIADVFAGIQIAATGSRVNGDFIERWDGDYLRGYRSEWGKSVKSQSDYDFVVIGNIGNHKIPYLYEIAKLEIKAPIDLLKIHLNEKKINVPMWDFTRLPEHEKENVKQLFEAQRWGALMELHNTYQLSSNFYCCDEKPIIRWFKYAIDNGLI